MINKKKLIIIIIISFLIFNIYIFFTYSTHIIQYITHFDFYVGVRYCSNYTVNCEFLENKENQEIKILLRSKNISLSNKYSTYYKLISKISNYFQKHSEKYENYKVSILFSTYIGNTNEQLQLCVYNYNFYTKYKYNNIYDFNYMKLYFNPFLENEYIIQEKIFSNVEDLYIQTESIYNQSLKLESSKISMYFLQPMKNLKSIRISNYSANMQIKQCIDYIKEIHPNCEIICSK